MDTQIPSGLLIFFLGIPVCILWVPVILGGAVVYCTVSAPGPCYLLVRFYCVMMAR